MSAPRQTRATTACVSRCRVVVALFSASLMGEAAAQFCPVGSTYFATNYFVACAVGSCWASAPFPGSAIESGTYPSTNFACATSTPAAEAQNNTRYEYDNNGNRTSSRDPLAHTTGSSYDALNRLLQVTDPANQLTKYEYDATGNLSRITDPRNLATAYAFDGLGNQVRQSSPDTGTTVRTFDATGNVKTSVDARGVTATHTYDALNRVTKIVFSQTGVTTEAHTYAYDGGTAGAPNAKGRLTKLTDPAATTTYTYATSGRVSSVAQIVGTLTQTVRYGYNAAGQRTSTTTPSGQVIGYSYLNSRVVTITLNDANLVGGVVTMPFAAIGAWQWGNGTYTFRDFDLDGRLTRWEHRNGSSIARNDLTWDVANRITAIVDPTRLATSGSFGYDQLDRLTLAQIGNPAAITQQFAYDAVGNRTNLTIDGSLTNYTYAGTSNQLLALTGATSRSYAYDGAGNPAQINIKVYTYDLANRLVKVMDSAATLASYKVNGLGQRISKTVGNTTTRFVYDDQGRLLGEYDNSGKIIQETIWMDDLPIATLRPTGVTGTPTPVTAYYVHADHLGSPRAVTRPSDNAVMWRWDNTDAFGNNAANENPSGQGTFKYALRFPGQYYDTELGTHYNYFRDYDPGIGRYSQSDPIGLKGGVNTYAYVAASPISRMDPTGLAAYVCMQPLHACGNTGSRRCFFDFPGNPFYHQYLCVIQPNGNITCGGQDRSGGFLSSPGKPSQDSFPYNRQDMCEKRDDRPCVDNCVKRKLLNPERPRYGIPFGTDCQEWSDDALRQCQKECTRQ